MRRSSALPLPGLKAGPGLGIRSGSLGSRALRRVHPVQRGRLPIAVWIGVIGIAFAALLPVLQTSDATSAAASQRGLERDRARLQAEVRLLASQVGELSALNRVADVAQTRLNLVPARPTVVLTVKETPPPRLLPARFLPQQDLELVETLPWWQTLFDVFVLR
jgi:hypothetical protein